MKTQHRLAALGLVAGLLGGAQTAPADPGAPAKPDRAAWMRGALAPLVEKGTISQAQADAVISALEAARPAKGPRDHGPGGKGFRRGPGPFGPARLDAAASAIGVTPEELRTALRDGKSLADVAKEKGVDPEKVVGALVAELKAHLDQEVASGEHTRTEADQKLAGATERIRAFVNGEIRKGFGHHGPRGPRPDGAPAAPSSVTPSSHTTSA
jgi:hypothetical protein